MSALSRRDFSALALGASLLPISRMASAAPPGLKDYGPAPEFAGIDQWLNSDALTLRGLAGRVVLVDFWTYSCYNCVNTLPHVVGWYEQYRNQGFTVVGVHSPEFAYEKSTRNVAQAIRQHGIRYPVAQDNRFATWKAYDNHYWPAFYLVDKRGTVMRQHFGEGEYDEMDAAIQVLLAQPAPT